MPEKRYRNPVELCERANELRKQPVLAEKLLWQLLKAAKGKIAPRFRRQHPIHPYIVDFACVKARLIVEIDGMSHSARQNYDANRDKYLHDKGWTILRFDNDDVYKDAEGVALTILSKVSSLLAHP